MGGFELRERTADLGMLGRGSDVAEALAFVETGMFSVMADLDAVESRSTIRVSVVSVTSSDTETLAADWLNELLYRHEAEGFLPKRFRVLVSQDGT